jgi:hypothetical protein
MATTIIDESVAESLIAQRLTSSLSGETDIQTRWWAEEVGEDDTKFQVKLAVSHFEYTGAPGRGFDQATLTLAVLVVASDKLGRTAGSFAVGTAVSRLRKAVFSGVMVDATTGHEVKATGFRTREQIDEQAGERARVKTVEVVYLVTRSAGSTMTAFSPGTDA